MNVAIVPFSGGMDSTTILYHAAKRHDVVHAIAIQYGQRHLKREIDAGVKIVNTINSTKGNVVMYRTLDLSFFRDISNVSALTNADIAVAKAKDVMGDPQTVNYVPFRNMMMLSICSAYAETVGASTVYHGAAQADSVAGFWDGSKEFIDAINGVNILNRRHKIKIEAPLIDKSKKDIIEYGTQLGVPFGLTWTCYEGRDRACGECTACALRLKGFIDAKIKDPCPYEKDINWSRLI